jgi:hypothetical protein
MIFIGTDFCSLVETCKIKPVTIQSTDHQSVYINNVFKLATGCIIVPFLHLLFLSIGIRVSLKSPSTIGIPVPCSFKNLLTFKKKQIVYQGFQKRVEVIGKSIIQYYRK